MEVFITGLHIGLCFFLILVVLLQPGKGADFGAAMGGASQEVFGASGGVSLLSKITATVAAMFMSTSLGLAWFSNAPPGTDLTPEELMKGVEATETEAASGAALPASEASEGTETAPGATDGGEPASEGSATETAPGTPVEAGTATESAPGAVPAEEAAEPSATE